MNGRCTKCNGETDMSRRCLSCGDSPPMTYQQFNDRYFPNSKPDTRKATCHMCRKVFVISDGHVCDFWGGGK